jgi:uncharacterized protein YkwD
MRQLLIAILVALATPTWSQTSSSGTAFGVAPQLLVTSYHVVEGCAAIDLIAADGRRPAAIVDAEPTIDLALLAVVGVVQAKFDAIRSAMITGDIPQNLNFAVSIEVLADFLEKNKVPFRNAPRSTALDSARVAEMAQGFTYRLERSAKTQHATAPFFGKPKPPAAATPKLGPQDVAATPRATPKDSLAAQVPHLIVRQTNALRTAHGAQPVVVNEELSRTAAYFADFMARTDQHNHEADGNKPSARAKQHGYDFCMVSENIGMQFDSSGFATEELAQRFVAGWVRSLEHRKVMLDPDAMEMGTAVARSVRTGRYYAVQMFGRPRSAMYRFQIENRTGAPLPYRFAGETLNLPPRITRTHEHCRPAQLVMQNVADAEESIVPAHGDRFTVVSDGDGLRLIRR